jgi:hypothetical protein
MGMPVWFYDQQAKLSGSQIAEQLFSSIAIHQSSRDIAAPINVEQDVVFSGAVQSLPATTKVNDLETIRLGCLDLRAMPRAASEKAVSIVPHVG